MLSSQPEQEKRCPLCRATWIPGATPAVTVRRGLDGGVRLARHNATGQDMLPFWGWNTTDPAERERLRRIYDNPLAEAHRRQRVDPDAARFPPLRATPELINIDSDSEPERYAAEVESFNAMTRDIASVRARARTSQVSRNRRRGDARPAAVPRAQAARVARNDEETAEARNSLFSSLFQPYGQASAATLASAATSRPSYPVRSTSLRAPPAGTSTFVPRPGSGRALFTGDAAEQPRVDSRPPRLDVDIPRTSTAGSSPDTVIANDDVEIIRVSRRPTSTLAMPTPNWGAPTRTAEDQREHDLDMRAAALNAQELRLSEREAAIVRREEAVSAREERASALLRLAGAQQEERESLDRKQREEMERLMRD
jgi:hypothetical protein